MDDCRIFEYASVLELLSQSWLKTFQSSQDNVQETFFFNRTTLINVSDISPRISRLPPACGLALSLAYSFEHQNLLFERKFSRQFPLLKTEPTEWNVANQISLSSGRHSQECQPDRRPIGTKSEPMSSEFDKLLKAPFSLRRRTRMNSAGRLPIKVKRRVVRLHLNVSSTGQLEDQRLSKIKNVTKEGETGLPGNP